MKAKNSIKRIAFVVIGTLLIGQVHAQHSTTFKFNETAPAQVLRVMENNANALFSEINRKYDQDNSQLSLSSSSVTDFARNRIANMWVVSHFYCTRTSMNTRVLKMVGSDTYQVRNIPVCYKEAESDEYKYQSLVMEFDNQGKISDLYCAIPESALSVITIENNMESLRIIEMINTFLNNYFTAYFCKDLDVIELLFSKDALFVTGKAGRNVVYSVQNKKQYLAKLRGIFLRYSFINVRFDGVEIIQHSLNQNIYGVSLNQYWHVSNNPNTGGYSDEGRLFFIIDFTNKNQPEIVVTAWQPFKDANGNPIEYPEEDFFSLGDFQIE